MARSKKSIDEKINSPFAKSIRELMSEKGTTQDVLAEKIGKTRQTVSQYVNGISEPGYDTLVKIADHFGVSTDYLLGRPAPKTIDTTVQAVIACTDLAEENVTFLAKGKYQMRNNCPPAQEESFQILNPEYQAYFRARGALFLVNSLIELLQNNPETCMRAYKMYQFWCQEHTHDQRTHDELAYNYMNLVTHRLTEDEYMRYTSNEIAKTLDAHLVSKCLTPTNQNPSST